MEEKRSEATSVDSSSSASVATANPHRRKDNTNNVSFQEDERLQSINRAKPFVLSSLFVPSFFLLSHLSGSAIGSSQKF